MERTVRTKIFGLLVATTASLLLIGCLQLVTPVIPPTGSVEYTSANIGTLKYVPAGTFQRDGTASNTSAVSAFRMSQYEITRAQFLAILGTDPVVAGGQTAYSSGTSDPVMYVNWYYAITFCNKLSIAEGLTPVYKVLGVDFATLPYADIPTASHATWNAATATWTSNGYRLPTEMEWMWAAMGAPADGQGGGTNTTGYLKAFAGSTGSNAIDDYAWYTPNLPTNTHPVGAKKANELGLYDMSGNVYEWNWDRYDTYPTGAVTDYRGATSGSNRVLRGGSNANPASECAVAFRSNVDSFNQYFSFGFRVVRP